MSTENPNSLPSDDQPTHADDEEQTLNSELEEPQEYDTYVSPSSQTTDLDQTSHDDPPDDDQTVATHSTAEMPNTDDGDELATHFDPDLQAEVDSEQTFVTKDEGRTVNLDNQSLGGTAVIDEDDDEQTVITLTKHDEATAHLDSESSEKNRSAGGTTTVDGSDVSDDSVPPPRPQSNFGSATAAGFDRYELVDNFARGGLGNIWLARDISIRREVAYKELLPRALKNRNLVERFLEEAQITGQLEHPGIVPIYEVGEQANGTPFYSMKLVRGETMEVAIEAMHSMPKGSVERNLAFKKLLGDFVDVSNAIGFAHNRGVLHRDLKPLNIMLGAFGETLVLDWGLAKIIGTEETEIPDDQTVDEPAAEPTSTDIFDEEETIAENPFDQQAPANSAASTSGASQNGGTRTQSGSIGGGSQMVSGVTGTGAYLRQSVSTDVRTDGSRTIMGSVMGTPSYMPPEQAKGDVSKLDARSDIYALGAILYKLLTNELPIGRGKLHDVLKEIANGNILPPRQIDSSIAPPLEAVTMKALAKVQDDRYQSAVDLAGDVEAWLADEPVSCYDEPLTYRAGRWIRRNTTLVMTTAVAITLLVVGGSGFTIYENNRIQGLRNKAESLIGNAESAVQSQEFAAAQSHLVEALGVVASAEESLSDLKSAVEAQQKIVDAQALDFQRERIESQIEVAREAIEAKSYDKAKQLLNEAGGAIASETVRQTIQPRIDEQFQVIQNRVEAEENLRVSNVERLQRAALAKANEAYKVNADVEDAKTQLAAVITTLKNEPKLDSLLKEVQSFSELIDAEQIALSTFAGFRSELRQARYYEGLIAGDSRNRFLKEARGFANKALKRYGVDATHPLKLPIPHLPQKKSEQVQVGIYQLLTIMAESEVDLARHEEKQKLDEAIRRALAWLAVTGEYGDQFKSRHLHAAAYFELLGNAQAHDDALATAAKRKAASALDAYQVGTIQLVNQDIEQALVHFRKTLEFEPDHFESLCGIGQCQILKGDFIRALPSYTAAIAAQPDFPYPYIQRGVIYAKLRQSDGALADFEKAIAIQPDLAEIYLNRGAAFLLLKRFNEAIADSKKASTLRPDWAAPLVNLAEAYYRKGKQAGQTQNKVAAQAEFQQAFVALTTAAQITSRHPWIYRLRADVYREFGQTTNAIDDYRNHIKYEYVKNRIAESHKRIGVIFYDGLKDIDKAGTEFDRSFELNPNDSETVLFQADVLSLKAQRAQAAGDLRTRDQFDRASTSRYSDFLEMEKLEFRKHKQAPRLMRAFVSRGLINGRKNKHREALRDYSLSLEFEPAPNIFKRRAFVYLNNANQLALQDLNDAVTLNPGDPDSFNGRGYAKARLGDYAGAEADAKKAESLSVAIVRKYQTPDGSQAWPLLFNTSLIYAQSVAHAESDVKTDESKREALVKQLTDKSVALIKKSSQIAGTRYRSQLLKAIAEEAGLDPIRNRDEFKQAIKSLR